MKYLLILLLLTGCAKSTPTENIVDNHITHANQTLDYAYNNIEQTQDVVFLEKELESCVIGLENTKQSYYAEIAKCNSETSKWRIISLFLGLVIVGAVLIKVKRVLL